MDRRLVGFVDAPVSPTDDPARLGSVRLLDPGPFTVREHVTARIVHRVGHHGLDDRGALKVVMRFPADGGAWQLDDPAGLNYVSVSASRPCGFRGKFEAFGHARPWFKVLTVQVVGGCLAEGDEITLTLGDRRGGSPGLRLQTFCEDECELRVLVDPCATGHFVEVGVVTLAIGPDVPHTWRLVGPTRWPAGVPLRLGVRADDRWGNPTDRTDRDVVVRGLGPDRLVEHRGFATVLEGLVAEEPGVLRLTLHDLDGTWLADAPAIVVTAGGDRSWWGDLHGQSAESIGTNSADAYFRFGRDRAFLDACAHQANDFQITSPFWDQLAGLTAAYHEPGRFVTLPGFEWSGNTAVGGDRNVYYRTEGRPIRRSSHALLTDRSDVASDCTTARALFEALATEDAVAYAHVGGRWADLRYAHDGRTERAVEIHSDWGTFEWLLDDAIALGHRVGVVANSDGHKGRPGASHPGASTFGAYGGLTCFLAPALTRDDLFRAIRDRRTVATTGCRLDLDLRLEVPGGVRLREDPAFGPTEADPLDEATIGDLVRTDLREAVARVRVVAASPIDTLDLLCGSAVVHRWRPPEEGRRIAVRWEGAKYRGRGREVAWDGRLELDSARILGLTRINAWNPDHELVHDDRSARWQAVTTGNFGGFDLVLDESDRARLRVVTGPATLDVALADLDRDGVRVDAGGLGMALSARRLPDRNDHRDVAVTARVPLDPCVRARVTLEDGHQAWTSPIWIVR